MIRLPLLQTGPQRPVFAQGPRSLSSVRLLRLSLTDRCNLRCVYCMPEDGVPWMAPQSDLLTADDFIAVAEAAVALGVEHVKLTGGEPTIRPDLIEIVTRLKKLGVVDLSMTTNALRLDQLARPLRDVGLDRLTVSCDSLRPDRYASITGSNGRTNGSNGLDQFWRGVEGAEAAGFDHLKLNVVVINSLNDDEMPDFARLTLDRNWTVRFIEFMPLGDSVLTEHDAEHSTLDNEVIKQRIADQLGPLEPVSRDSEIGVGPAEVFRLNGARGRLGFISAMSQPFCESCNRLRLTARGELRSCLFDGGEVDLLPALRPQIDRSKLVQFFADCVAMRPEVHSSRGNRAMSQVGG